MVISRWVCIGARLVLLAGEYFRNTNFHLQFVLRGEIGTIWSIFLTGGFWGYSDYGGSLGFPSLESQLTYDNQYRTGPAVFSAYPPGGALVPHVDSLRRREGGVLLQSTLSAYDGRDSLRMRSDSGNFVPLPAKVALTGPALSREHFVPVCHGWRVSVTFSPWSATRTSRLVAGPPIELFPLA